MLIYKSSGDKYVVELEYRSPDLEEGETITEASATVSPAGLTLTGSVEIDENFIRQMIGGGTVGVKYLIQFMVKTSANHIYCDPRKEGVLVIIH